MDKRYGTDPRDPLSLDLNPGLSEPGYGMDDRMEISSNEARQGGTGRPVLYVLVAALILGALYVMGSAFYSNDAVNTEAGRIASTQSREATAPTPPAMATPPGTETGPNMRPLQ